MWLRRRNTSRKAATHCLNYVAVEATNEVYCLAPHLFSQFLTAQALFAIKIRRTRTQTAIPCECLLGGCVLCTQADNSNGVAAEATNRLYCLAPHLFSQSLTAQRIFAIKTRRINNQAAVSQDYLLGEAHFVRKRKILSQFSICHCEEQRSCDVAIQRSAMRLCLDSHATAPQWLCAFCASLRL